MLPGRWNLEEFPNGTWGFEKNFQTGEIFELFPLKALYGTNIFTIIVTSRQNTSGLSIDFIVLNFLKIWNDGTGTVELRRLTGRYVWI
jgi:hypothetical protein